MIKCLSKLSAVLLPYWCFRNLKIKSWKYAGQHIGLLGYEGHKTCVIALSAPRDIHHVIASLSIDGEIKIWNTLGGNCLFELQTEAHTLVLFKGNLFLTCQLVAAKNS